MTAPLPLIDRLTAAIHARGIDLVTAGWAAEAVAPFVQEWQPIETAPRDGTQLMLWDTYGWIIGAWIMTGKDEWCWGVKGGGNFWRGGGPFTHWQPLPAAPVQP